MLIHGAEFFFAKPGGYVMGERNPAFILNIFPKS